MERETIVYRGKKYHRYPKSKRRQLRVYFWRHDKWKAPPFALHRQIWIDNFGEIPKGMSIHHKDGNSLNNELSNLILLTKSTHASKHSNEPYRKEIGRRNIKIAQKFAIKWHKSPEGRKWHSEHIKNQWKTGQFKKSLQSAS